MNGVGESEREGGRYNVGNGHGRRISRWSVTHATPAFCTSDDDFCRVSHRGPILRHLSHRAGRGGGRYDKRGRPGRIRADMEKACVLFIITLRHTRLTTLRI